MHIIDIHNLEENIDKSSFIDKFLNNKEIDVEVIYESDFQNTKFLRDFIEIVCQKLGLEHLDISRFILLVDELNNNAIEYGSLKGCKNKLRLKTSGDEKSVDLNIEIEDCGNGEKHKTALEMETLRAHQLKLGYGHHESIRGRGLFMITVKSVDRLYFKDSKNGGLIVGIKKNIKLNTK